MPRKQIVQQTLDIENDQAEFLNEMKEKYGLADTSKALRILLDYAITDADQDFIFAMENMRCRHCVI